MLNKLTNIFTNMAKKKQKKVVQPVEIVEKTIEQPIVESNETIETNVESNNDETNIVVESNETIETNVESNNDETNIIVESNESNEKNESNDLNLINNAFKNESTNEEIVETTSCENVKLKYSIGSLISFHRNKHINGVNLPIIAIFNDKYVVKHNHGQTFDKQTCAQYKLSEKIAYILLKESEIKNN